MPDRYWVGGTASWDGTAGTKWAASSGGPGGETVPTTADDVFFTNLSTGVCTIATGNTGAKSINCTGFAGTITGSAAITVAGSITLVSGMTYTHTGTVTITGTGTLTTAGKEFSGLIVDGAGITVTLGDALNTGLTRGMTVNRGTFNTANFNLNTIFLASSNTNTRTITLGSSTVTVTVNGGGINFASPTGLTFNAGTSQINLTSPSAILQGGGQTFHNVSFTAGVAGTRAIVGSNTFNNLSLTASVLGLSQLTVAANQTINGTFTCSGSAARNRGFVLSNTIGTSRTITAAALSANNCDFRDITIAGGAAGTAPTLAGDCGGNSGITFPVAKTVYWNITGALYGWDANAWASTSNGTPALDNFPLPQDTAVFTDSGTIGQINIASVSYNFPAIDMSNRTASMTLNVGANIFVYGSFIIGSGITISGSATVTFHGRSTMTFTSAGKTITFSITVDAPSGTFQLGDSFPSIGTFTLTRGTLTAGTYDLTTLRFISSNSNTRTINMGFGTWTLTGTGDVWDLITVTNLTFNKDTANIILTNTTTTARTFAGGGLTYNKLTIGGTTGTSTLTINGTNTFSELASTKTVNHTIAFGGDNIITTWSVTGTVSATVTINSTSTGTQRNLTVTNKTSNIDYLSVTDINSVNVTPCTFYAGSNSLVNNNVTGVVFAARGPSSTSDIYVLTTGTSFTVPANWNNSNNEIHLIGGGGGGAGRGSATPLAGAGGGGGGYTKLTNYTLTPSGTVAYTIGSGGTAGATTPTNGGTGGNTTFDTVNVAGGASGGATNGGTPGTGGTGTTFNGGNGSTAGGAGGAGGPGGAGNNGSSVNGGAGGGGSGGFGGTTGTAPASGYDILGVAGSGGGGPAGTVSTIQRGGLYGGGGGGGSGTSSVGGVGRQGVIIVYYVPASAPPPSTANVVMRMTSNGNLLLSAADGIVFDEITQTNVRVNGLSLYAAEFDEVTKLSGVSSKVCAFGPLGNVTILGEFDEVSGIN